MFSRGLLCGALAAGVVDGVVGVVFAAQNQLADRDNVIALPQQIVQNARQSLWGVKGRIVEEHNGARPHAGDHPLGDGGRVVILPVQTIPVGSGCKGGGPGRVCPPGILAPFGCIG